jgi:hypothetical protein
MKKLKEHTIRQLEFFPLYLDGVSQEEHVLDNLVPKPSDLMQKFSDPSLYDDIEENSDDNEFDDDLYQVIDDIVDAEQYILNDAERRREYGAAEEQAPTKQRKESAKQTTAVDESLASSDADASNSGGDV